MHNQLLRRTFLQGVATASGSIIVGFDPQGVPGWPIQSNHIGSFLVGWGAVLIGIVTHIGVGSVKRARSQGGLPPIIAVGDFFMIVNAKAGQVLRKLLLALIGFFGLVFGSGVNNVTPFYQAADNEEIELQV